jgi:hypothetical protein
LKPPRGILPVVAAALVLLAGAACLALDPSLQTWVLRRFLAGRPGLGTTVGSATFGPDAVTLRDVRIERGGAVLVLPSVQADLPVIPALFGRNLRFRHLAIRGWTLDLRGPARRGPAAVARSGPRAFSFLPSASAADALARPAGVFSGILSQLRLPVGLSLDGLEAEGDVILPDAGGRPGGLMHIILSGGGLSPGREGTFLVSLGLPSAVAGGLVNSLTADGKLVAAMDGPRAFRKLDLSLDAVASGPGLRRPVRLSATLGAELGPRGESYTVSLAGEKKELLSLRAAFPDARGRISGQWKLNVCDDDLAPFMLGRPLPLFNGAGAGSFGTDAALSGVDVGGRLDFTADRLGVLLPRLSGVGALRVGADFDLARAGGALRVDRLAASVSGDRPAFSVQGLQSFAFNPANGELTVADTARDLFAVTLQDVPVEWAQPFLRGFVLTGGTLRGSLVAGARNGGLSLRSSAPLTIAELSIVRGGDLLVRNVSLSLAASADYNPDGWQLEVESRAATALLPGPLYRLEARIGRLAAQDQPVKMTGRLSLNLPALLAQPAISDGFGGRSLSSGTAVCDFAASFSESQAVSVRVAVSGVATPGESLPDASAVVRARFGPGGRLAFDAPIRISQDGRESDLTLSGTAAMAPAGVAIDGRVTGGTVFLNDARILAVIFAGRRSFQSVMSGAGSGEGGAAPGRMPFWAGISGRLALSLKSVVARQLTATDVTGTVVLMPDRLRFDGVHATLGDAGDARLSGSFDFESAATEPYALTADVDVGGFDPAPLFRALYPGREPTVDGRFSIAGKFTGRGGDPYAAATGARGELTFTGKSGVLRLFSMSPGAREGAARRIALFGQLIGDLTGAVMGRRDLGQSIGRVTAKISAIPYDQMSFVLARDTSPDGVLRDFTLISPEVRILGGGRLAGGGGEPLLERPLTAEFSLRARGDTAAVFRLVNLLGDQPDDLGYYDFTEPLRVTGTLGKPDTSALQAALMARLFGK